jgi:hypothetical protein
MTDATAWLAGVTLPRPAPDWADRSLIAFAGPQDGHGLPPSVALSRDERSGPTDPVGESFDAYVQRQSQTLESSLPGFEHRTPTPFGAGTSESRDVLFSWRSGAISLTQWVVWLAMKDGTVLTYTATSESSLFDGHRHVFEATLRNTGIDAGRFAPAAA